MSTPVTSGTEILKIRSARLIRSAVPPVEQIREYLPTFITELFVMCSQILIYKLAARYLGKVGFAEYALARRTVSLLFPVPVLGLSVGLPRYLGFSIGRGDQESASRYYGAALWCVGGAAALCVALMNILRRTFAFLFFGNASYGYLILPLSLMILGLCAHTVACGYFRGHQRMNRANILQVVNLAVVPIIAFVLFGSSLSRALTAIGVVSTIVAAAMLSTTPFRAIFRNNCDEAKELLVYGIQRVPGDFVLVALFTLPATFTAHWRGVQEAGFVAFGVSVVAMIGSVFAPISLVLLPKATLLFATGACAELRRHLRSLLQMTLGASCLIALVIWIGIPRIVNLYLGLGFDQVVPIVRVLVLGAVPYSLYLVLRNLVDAYHKHGVTAAILCGGLCVFLLGIYLDKYFVFKSEALLAIFVVTQLFIAALSGWECQRILRDQPV